MSSAWPRLFTTARTIVILADALEEAGHFELAEHFRQETWPPKGCWVVDMILGKS